MREGGVHEGKTNMWKYRGGEKPGGEGERKTKWGSGRDGDERTRTSSPLIVETKGRLNGFVSIILENVVLEKINYKYITKDFISRIPNA